MYFSAAAALMVAAFAANAVSSPTLKDNVFARRDGCDCTCRLACNTNCANGFGGSYQSSQGICIATCVDSCGCSQDAICCGDGSSCTGYGCCAANTIPENSAGYAPGWCGVHVIQYQKPNPATDSYGLDVTIFDANQKQIGSTGGKVGPSAVVDSLLPYTLDVSTGNVDDDPVIFAYASSGWDSGDGTLCSLGAYDSGSRQMDCGFSC